MLQNSKTLMCFLTGPTRWIITSLTSTQPFNERTSNSASIAFPTLSKLKFRGFALKCSTQIGVTSAIKLFFLFVTLILHSLTNIQIHCHVGVKASEIYESSVSRITKNSNSNKYVRHNFFWSLYMFYVVTQNLIHSNKAYNISLHFSVLVNEISKIQKWIWWYWPNSKINLPEGDQFRTHVNDSDYKVNEIV